MINYQQGNSYGNNFINGDEALFEDASLQRDKFGFMIRPGQQTRNYAVAKSSSSGADTNGVTELGYMKVGGAVIIVEPTITTFHTIKIKEKYSNIGFGTFRGKYGDIAENDILDSLKMEKRGGSFAVLEDGNIVLSQNGIYHIDAVCRFCYPTTWQGQSAGERIVLYVNGEEKTYAQNNIVAGIDDVRFSEAIYLKAGDTINMGFTESLHIATYVYKDVLCIIRMSLVKLS